MGQQDPRSSGIRADPRRRSHHRPIGTGVRQRRGDGHRRTLAGRPFQTVPGHDIIDHYTYGLASDGDLQEGVASEAASLAGTLGLGKLVFIYDDNGISIEGDTDIAFLENVGQRFEAYGWQVLGPIDGLDLGAVNGAIAEAKSETARPSLIVCRTVIGYGSPNKAGTAGVHGAPLGEDEVGLTREQLQWPYSETFTIPGEAQRHFDEARDRGKKSQEEWQAAVSEYRESYPAEAQQLDEALSGELPEGWERAMEGLFDDGRPVATREASGRVMNAISGQRADAVGWLGRPGAVDSYHPGPRRPHWPW